MDLPVQQTSGSGGASTTGLGGARAGETGGSGPGGTSSIGGNDGSGCQGDGDCPRCGACGDETVCVPYQCVTGSCQLTCSQGSGQMCTSWQGEQFHDGETVPPDPGRCDQCTCIISSTATGYAAAVRCTWAACPDAGS